METIVILFKRKIKENLPELKEKFMLQEIQIDTNEKTVYAKQIQTNKKQETKLATLSAVLVTKAKVVEMGF